MAFNIRVYGILLDEERGVLLSNEVIRGKEYVKFPGGGLEYGEGTRDCLQREFMEEMNLRVKVGEHFYTTDFFQPSAFRKGDQILSIYYYVHPVGDVELNFFRINPEATPSSLNPHATSEFFHFVPFSDFSVDILSLPIDKIVAGMLVGDIGKRNL